MQSVKSFDNTSFNNKSVVIVCNFRWIQIKNTKKSLVFSLLSWRFSWRKWLNGKLPLNQFFPRHAARTLLEFVTRGNASRALWGSVGGWLTCYKSYNSRSTVTWVYLHHRFTFSWSGRKRNFWDPFCRWLGRPWSLDSIHGHHRTWTQHIQDCHCNV